MIAPVKPCVVETGKPATVANITVMPAPRATAKRKYSEPTTASGTRPLPEKRCNSDCARKMEQIEPLKVASVAQRIAVL